MANNKFYGFQPKSNKTTEQTALLDKYNPYEFRKGMDYELTELGCMRLKESTPEEREKATEKVLKNLESHPAYYSGLLQFESGMNHAGKIEGKNFKTWLNDHFDINKMQPAIDEKFNKPKNPTFKNDKMEELKEAIKKEMKIILNEQGGAKAAAMADMEDDGEKEGDKKSKGKAKKNKPVRKDRFDREEEAIKDILFRVDAKGKKPKEEGDYTKDNPAPGSMLFIKDQLLEKYKTEIKDEIEDPKKREEAYNKLQKEENAKYEEAFKKFDEEFNSDGQNALYQKENFLFQTIKNLQERLKLGLDKARAGVEEEARGTRYEIAKSQMTRTEALRLLEIVRENGISLREGTENVKVYYEIAKTAYLEGVANALKL
tara:strand:+ start:569 stop:1687 length:1119 start_codon:yes stop_codon:yes gene_type:complete